MPFINVKRYHEKKDNNLNSNKFIIIATIIKQLIASRR